MPEPEPEKPWWSEFQDDFGSMHFGWKGNGDQKGSLPWNSYMGPGFMYDQYDPYGLKASEDKEGEKDKEQEGGPWNSTASMAGRAILSRVGPLEKEACLFGRAILSPVVPLARE